jgi:hypothetical protein
MSKFEFNAKAAGDGECFCFFVDKETYIKFCGEQSYVDELNYLEESNTDVMGPLPFEEPTVWKLYPHHFFKSGSKLKIKIEVEELPLEIIP